MKKIILLLSLFLFLAQAPALAFGTGIGVTFPVGGGGTRAEDIPSYAALRTTQILEELSVEERHGRLEISYKLTNLTDHPYSVDLRDGQVYEISVLDREGEPLWNYSDGMAFTQALTSYTLDAKKSDTMKAKVERRDYKKFRDDAVFVVAYIKGTDTRLITRVPSRTEYSFPTMIHGGVIFGDGDYYDD